MKKTYIPKVIHYCWFGGNELGKKEIDCINRWKKIMPEYKIIRWDETNYDVNKNDFMKEAYKNKKWAFVSDYARLDIIYNYGGLYFDTDVETIKKFDNLLDNECFIGFESSGYLATGLGFGAKKNNQFVKMNLDKYNNIKFDINDNNSISCPRITTELLKEMNFKIDNTYQKNNLVTLYPADFFCPQDFYTYKLKITNNTYSIHHYSMSWHSKRDKRWKKISILFSRIFGKKVGDNFALVLKLPGSIIIRLKNTGFKSTFLYYKNIIRR